MDRVMSELVNYDRSPDGTSEGFSATVAEIVNIVVKSIRTLFYVLSLSKLFFEIQAAIRQGTLPVFNLKLRT